MWRLAIILVLILVGGCALDYQDTHPVVHVDLAGDGKGRVAHYDSLREQDDYCEDDCDFVVHQFPLVLQALSLNANNVGGDWTGCGPSEPYDRNVCRVYDETTRLVTVSF